MRRCTHCHTETNDIAPSRRWCRTCIREYNRNRASGGGGGSRGGRRFGVEIEFLGSRETVAEEMRARGLSCSIYSSVVHRVARNAWKVVPDGSILGGAELVSPPLRGEEGKRQLRIACEALEAAEATVNRETGLHVHHDAGDLDARAFGRVFRYWHTYQDQIDRLVARSRRDGNNTYCRRLEDGEVEAAESLLDIAPTLPSLRDAVMRVMDYGMRYRTLNVCSYPRYGTLEIRQHQGTLNADKILAWVEFGQSVFAWAKSDASLEIAGAYAPDGVVGSMADMLRHLLDHGLTRATADFLAERAAALSAVGDRLLGTWVPENQLELEAVAA